eukprot:gene4184-20369_t
MCDGDEFKFRILWARLLHHICDDHDFCTHEPILDEDQEKIFLSSNSGTMEELRQIVLDLAWMKSLAHYTRNRHTGMIEKHDAFTKRSQLEFIDHNKHLGRAQMTTKSGDLVFVRKWGKRTKTWHCVPVLIPKEYNYIGDLQAKILWRRHMHIQSTQVRQVARATTKLLTENVVSVPPPPTAELLARHVKRMDMKFES